jgi:hypothetical protein
MPPKSQNSLLARQGEVLRDRVKAAKPAITLIWGAFAVKVRVCRSSEARRQWQFGQTKRFKGEHLRDSLL